MVPRDGLPSLRQLRSLRRPENLSIPGTTVRGKTLLHQLLHDLRGRLDLPDCTD